MGLKKGFEAESQKQKEFSFTITSRLLMILRPEILVIMK